LGEVEGPTRSVTGQLWRASTGYSLRKPKAKGCKAKELVQRT